MSSDPLASVEREQRCTVAPLAQESLTPSRTSGPNEGLEKQAVVYIHLRRANAAVKWIIESFMLTFGRDSPGRDVEIRLISRRPLLTRQKTNVVLFFLFIGTRVPDTQCSLADNLSADTLEHSPPEPSAMPVRYADATAEVRLPSGGRKDEYTG